MGTSARPLTVLGAQHGLHSRAWPPFEQANPAGPALHQSARGRGGAEAGQGKGEAANRRCAVRSPSAQTSRPRGREQIYEGGVVTWQGARLRGVASAPVLPPRSQSLPGADGAVPCPGHRPVLETAPAAAPHGLIRLKVKHLRMNVS